MRKCNLLACHTNIPARQLIAKRNLWTRQQFIQGKRAPSLRLDLDRYDTRRSLDQKLDLIFILTIIPKLIYYIIIA